MLRKFLITACLAALSAAPAQAAERILLMPGVSYEKQVEFTSHGPVAIHVVLAPKPGGLWALKPVLSNGAVVARERLTAMQQGLAPQTTSVGVNGDYFSEPDGRPNGIALQSGVLAHPPHGGRSSIGIGADGALRVERVRMFGTWRGTGQRRPLDLNEAPGTNGVTLFAPSWGPTTPPVPGGIAAIIHALPATAPNAELGGAVAELRPADAAIEIPPAGAVMIARGTGAQRLQAEAPAGTNLAVRFVLAPSWSDVPDAIGGGPALVREGRAVFRHSELFATPQLGRSPRAAVGQLADGRVVLVAVDGRQRGYSVGMTSFELARTLVRLGAVRAGGLGVGAQVSMAFEGKLLNRPAAPAEEPVAGGLFVFYGGVYAPPPTEQVVSPNGDGYADATELVYKLVRPARVTATLVGPERAVRTLDAGERPPGAYRFTWVGRRADGAAEADGRWRFVVTATDTSGQTSTAERVVQLNRTLGALSVAPAAVDRGGSVGARFTLTRAARVRVTIETQSGALLALVTRRSLAAGDHTISWNGRIGGGPARGGRYLVRVRAENEIGGVELTVPFLVRS